MASYQMVTKSVQNRRQVQKRDTGANKWVGKQKGLRSKMQSNQVPTDYALDDFEEL